MGCPFVLKEKEKKKDQVFCKPNITNPGLLIKKGFEMSFC